MTIDNVLEILEKHKLYIPSNVFYELKADIVNFEEPTTKNDLGVDKLLAGCEKMSFEIEIFNKPLRVVALDAVKNIVKDLFSVTPQEPRWIPVSKRLPEEYKRVLVFDSWGGVYVGQYIDAEENWGGEHFINEAGTHSKTVVAWMPLPKPYREVE